jgi:hypothetical protein
MRSSDSEHDHAQASDRRAFSTYADKLDLLVQVERALPVSLCAPPMAKGLDGLLVELQNIA